MWGEDSEEDTELRFSLSVWSKRKGTERLLRRALCVLVHELFSFTGPLVLISWIPGKALGSQDDRNPTARFHSQYSDEHFGGAYHMRPISLSSG